MVRGNLQHKIEESVTHEEVIAFVVLHYLTYELTSECIDSLVRLDELDKNHDIRCVVVDNASKNGSLERLMSQYGVNNPKVHFIANEQNYGYSHANNIGFNYACQTWMPRFVIVANNDTKVKQANFADVLDKIYESNNQPFLIGPDIYCERLGYHQSPMKGISTIDEAMAKLEVNIHPYEKHNILIKIKRLGYLIPGLKTIFSKISFRRSLNRNRAFNGWKNDSMGDVTLQGACLIFTPRFLATDEEPFCPETFLYEEENILAYRFKANGWPVLYTPKLQIIHYDDGATDRMLASGSMKRQFIRTNEVDSLRVLLKLMDKE